MIPDDGRAADPLAALLLALGLAATVAVAGAATPAVAGDEVAIFSPSPHEVEADPGEEFEVDVWLRSHGGFEGDAVASVDLIARYHPDYLEVVDVEPGPWMEGGDATVETATTLAHDEGLAILEQRRADGGTTGEDVVATLTVAVDPDAPPSEATIDVGESIVTLESDYPQPVHDRNVTVSIAGGGDRHEPFDHGDPRAHLDGAGDDAGNGTDTGANGNDETAGGADDGDDPTGPFDPSLLGPAAVALGALMAVAALLVRSRS